MKIDPNKQGELYITTQDYDNACKTFENQNSGWKPACDKSQEFRNVCRSNFITGYLAAINDSKGISIK